MRLFISKYLSVFLLLCILIIANNKEVSAQNRQQPYNRFQYHKFKWRSFHTEAFHIYFPYGYDSLCKYVAGELPEAMTRIKHRMNTTLLDIPNVIIYASVDQFYESNIGLYETDQNTLPTLVKSGNRLVLFFNGDHDALKAQLYEALVRSIWEAQLKETIQQQAVGNYDDAIPYWFRQGAVKHFAHGWTVQAEDALRRAYADNNYSNWHQVIAAQPTLAGQAFCYFLNDQFYKEAMMQLYGQLRDKKELRRAIRLIAKKELDSLQVQCFEFYEQRFENTMNSEPGIDTAHRQKTFKKKKGIVTQLTVHPKGQSLLYTVHKNNKRKVYHYDLQKNQTQLIAQYNLPPWIVDHSANKYPLAGWNTSFNSVMLTLPDKKGIYIKHYNANNGNELSKDVVMGIDGVSSNAEVSNNEYILSGYRKGQSDIVQYNANRYQYQTITADVFDDTYLTGGMKETIFFISKRPTEDSTLAQGIYLHEGDNTEPVAIDTTEYIKWGKLQNISNYKQLATHTKYGTERWAVVDNGSKVVTTLGQYKPVQFNSNSETVQYYVVGDDSVSLYRQPLKSWIEQNKTNDTTSAWLKDYRKRAKERAEEDSILNAAKDDQYSFLKDIFVPEDAAEKEQAKEDSISRSLQYNAKKVKPYILQLHSAYFTAKVNNDYFINRYQPYLNYQGQFKFPDISAMLQGGFTDLFENHHISIGFRVPAGTDGSDFFINYRNTAKKLDWGITYFRKAELLQGDPNRLWQNENGDVYPNIAKVKTHYGAVSLSYPITYYLSVNLDEAVRYDRTIFLATNKRSLPFEDIKSVWSITSLSLKQYKLRPTIPLLSKGYMVKLFADVFKGFSQTEDGVVGLNINAEYHQPLYRYITAVVKMKAGTSRGDKYVLYNLGGVDNNMTVRTDSTVQFNQSDPYAFQTLITSMRGYLQNSIYGNRYALLNADVYFPIFQTLVPVETPLSFINNIQLGLFTDLGTAAETWKTPQVKTGWLSAYGWSVRTTLVGYPIRFDMAWPGNFGNKPVWYLSLNVSQ